MSRIVLSLAALLAAVAATAQITVVQPIDLEAGEPCDTMRYVVYYDLAFVKDTTDAADKPINEMTRLEVGDRVQYFYSNKSFQADSANAIVMKNGGNYYNGDGQIQWRLYKNYPAEGKNSLLEKFGMDRFVCTEDYAAPAWQPVADSSAVILGYQCSMAVATYKGRTWYAWYAEDIPLDAGPWKLGGLPGLILRAYDAQKHYDFTAAGIVNADPQALIYYKGGKYEPVNRKTLNGIYRRYYADPAGYITNNPKITVRYQDKFGNDIPSPKNEPYNPIEK